MEKLLKLPKLETVILDVAQVYNSYSGLRFKPIDTTISGTSLEEFKKSYVNVIEKLKAKGVLVTMKDKTADWLYNSSSNESLSLRQLGWALNSIID